AECIVPELGNATTCHPDLLGNDWKEVFRGYNQGMADFASYNPDRLLCAYQLPLLDIDFAVKEVTRLAKDHKARCVQLTPFPSDMGRPECKDKRSAPLCKTIEEAGRTTLNHLAG